MGNSHSSDKESREYRKFLRAERKKHMMSTLDEFQISARQKGSKKGESEKANMVNWKARLEERLMEVDGNVFAWKDYLLSSLPPTTAIDISKWQADTYWRYFNEKHKKTRTIERSLMKTMRTVIIGKRFNRQPQHRMFRVMEKIMRQLKTYKAHPLSVIFKQYKAWFKQKYMTMMEMSQLRSANVNSLSKEMVLSLKKFLGIMSLTIIDYYKIEGITEIEKDICLMFCTRRLLKGSINNLLLNIITANCEADIRTIMESMDNYQKITLSDLHVDKHFAFDPKARELYKVKKTRRKSNDWDSKKVIVWEDNNSTTASKGSDKNDGLMAHLTGKYSYEKAIDCLMKIKHKECPEDKISLLYEMNNLILEEIEAFWDGYEIPEDKLKIDHDNLLSIYAYIVIQSQYAKLWAEIQYIDAFLTESSKLSNRGYFMANIAVAMEHVLHKDILTAKVTPSMKSLADNCMPPMSESPINVGSIPDNGLMAGDFDRPGNFNQWTQSMVVIPDRASMPVLPEFKKLGLAESEGTAQKESEDNRVVLDPEKKKNVMQADNVVIYI